MYKANYIIFIIYCLAFAPQGAMSQQNTPEQITLRGQVTSKETGENLETATVHIVREGSNKLAGYTFTDANGRFSIQFRNADSLQISVSFLGYKTYKQPIVNSGEYNIQLESQAFNLREVQVKPGRVWGRQDTINYDVTQFLSEKDETIKDVIKKLPGIDVDEIGKISYNGKNISNLYVEGMDLSDGRYNKITNNLQAKSVETLQLMQNHQPIRLLQNKISTEDVAMNIKLKPEFRDKWMFTVRGGVGFSPLLWDASVNAMQLNRKSQSTYNYKSNNTGNDVVDEGLMMISRFSGRMREPQAPSFLSQPSIMAPVRKNRLLFNDVHSISGNRLYKLNETTQLRINADYTHDIRRQERGSETSYFYPDDTVSIAEQSNSRIQSDVAELKLYLENNATDKFLTNEFSANGNWQKSNSGISGYKTINQQIKTPEIYLRNDFRCLWEKSGYTLEARSLSRYNHHTDKFIAEEYATSDLSSDKLIDKQKQFLNINSFYTDNYLSILNKKGIFTQQYSTGVNAEVSNIHNRYGIYLNPLWQLNDGKWQTSLSTPLILTLFPRIKDIDIITDPTTPYPTSGENINKSSRFAVNPSFSASYKLNYAWRFSLSAMYNEQYGSMLNLYTTPYLTDYRHEVQNRGILPIQRAQNYSAYGEYKNTINEFFATLSLSYSRNNSNQIREQSFENDKIIYSSHQLSNTSDSKNIRGTISKGFYDLKMKMSLDYLFNNTRAWQFNNGGKIPLRINYMQYEPKISRTFSRYVEVAYESRFRYGGSKIGDNTKLTPLWNITQRLQLNYSISDFDVVMSADHYFNDINENKSVNACFADISFRWNHYDWQFAAAANNLFDKQQYRYTQYSDIQSYTSWINIRGREFLLSARYRF